MAQNTQLARNGRDREAEAAAKDAVAFRVDASAPIIKELGYSKDLFMRITLNAFSRVPKLMRCTNTSIHMSIMECAQAGLLPDGNEAAIVPFKNRKGDYYEATFMPMTNGLVKLAMTGTPGLTYHVVHVHQEDKFVYQEGLNPVLEHTPNLMSPNRTDRDIIVTYAILRVPGSSMPIFEVMTRAQIAPFVKTFGPWVDNYGEMAKKTVLKRALKRMPRKSFMPDLPEGEIGDAYVGTSAVPSGDTTTVDVLEEPPPAPALAAPPAEQPAPQDEGEVIQPQEEPEPEPEPHYEEDEEAMREFREAEASAPPVDDIPQTNETLF